MCPPCVSELSIDLTVIIPVYNSSSTLTEITARLQHTFARIGAIAEIIYVNDGSEDPSTW